MLASVGFIQLLYPEKESEIRQLQVLGNICLIQTVMVCTQTGRHRMYKQPLGSRLAGKAEPRSAEW